VTISREPRCIIKRVLWPAALLLCACIGHSAYSKSVALLVGVGKFNDPMLKTAQLLGPAADIDSMQKALTERWGFQPADVVTLRDQDATHEHILSQISALEQRSAPGDTVLIYFSGHGTSANENNNSYDLPYATGAWVPYDLDYGTPAGVQRTLIIGRRDLVPRLKSLDQAGRFVVVVSASPIAIRASCRRTRAIWAWRRRPSPSDRGHPRRPIHTSTWCCCPARATAKRERTYLRTRLCSRRRHWTGNSTAPLPMPFCGCWTGNCCRAHSTTRRFARPSTPFSNIVISRSTRNCCRP
jgi:hypothetical protein